MWSLPWYLKTEPNQAGSEEGFHLESPDRIGQFSGRMYINLETYKKNGEPKLTPVEAIVNNGIVYLQTGPRTWKVKRIRRNPRVRIVPCNESGKPTGMWVEGEARILEGEELEQAMALFKKEFGTIQNLLGRALYRLVRGQPLTAVIAVSLGK